MAGPRRSTADPQLAAARAFVRSLNILLKYARLYGCEHARTTAQSGVAWKELTAALPGDGKTGLMLGVSGLKLLIDGIPLEAGQSEQSFAQLLNAAGLASLHFASEITFEDFSRFVRAFAGSGNKPAELAEKFKTALGKSSAIRMNQVRFVAQSGEQSAAVSTLATQLAAQSLGEHAEKINAWISDPQKLLQVIAAAESSRMGSAPAATSVATSVATSAVSGGTTTVGGSAPAANPPEATPTDIINVIHMLTRFGESSQISGSAVEPQALNQQIATLSPASQNALQQALAQMAENSNVRPDTPLLVQLAEQMAIRFALSRFERGEVRVNAVRQMMDRMGNEMEALRKVLTSHGSKLSKAGVVVESHADILDRQFWAALPAAGKKSVQLSPDAWCIPARNIAQYVNELLEKKDLNLAGRILRNYAHCVQAPEAEGRMKTAIGLSHMAELYGRSPSLLQEALAQVGEQLAQEKDAELQKTLGTTFVRLSQEAATRRHYTVLQQAMACLDEVQANMPGVAERLRPRIGVHDRLEEYIEEAARSKNIHSDLLEMLRRMPQAAAEKLLQRFERCVRRDECERLIALLKHLGPVAAQYLKEKLLRDAAPEAVLTVGLLSRLDPKMLDDVLPKLLRNWNRFQQDVAIRQIAAAAAPERGRLLLKLMDYVDPVLLPQLLDELGMSGDRVSSPCMMSMAFDHAPAENSAYLRVKAIEALGRLRESKAESHLRGILDARQLWHWEHPRELRIAAAQGLTMLNPEEARIFIVGRGLKDQDMAFGPLDPMASCPWARQRRYPRVAPAAKVAGLFSLPKTQSRLEVNRLSLGGGLISSDRQVASGTQASLELQLGIRKVHAQVYMREEKSRQMSFEIVKIDLEERGKLRRLLTGDQIIPPGLIQQVADFAQMRATLW